MQELLGVRLYNVGPPRSPFNATLDLRVRPGEHYPSDEHDKRPRYASTAALILGDNGTGKTSLARLIRSVLDPRRHPRPTGRILVRAGSGTWQGLAPPEGVGQVILKWIDREQDHIFLTGLAIQRRDEHAFALGFFIVRTGSDINFDSLIFEQKPSSLSRLRRHLETLCTQSEFRFLWADSINEWHKQLQELGLGPSNVCLVDGDLSGAWINSKNDLIDRLTQLVIDEKELGEIFLLTEQGSFSASDIKLIQRKLTLLVPKVLKGLTRFERTSYWPPDVAEGARNLVTCTFEEPSPEQIEERIGRISKRDIREGAGLALLRSALREATNNSIVISVHPPDLVGTPLSIDKLKSCSGLEQRSIRSLLQLLLARFGTFNQEKQHQGCLVILDECLMPSAGNFNRHAEMMASWGFQAIYLSVHTYTKPSTYESLFSLHAIRQSDDKWRTVIAQAATLQMLRGGEAKPQLIAGMETAPITQIFEPLADTHNVEPGDLLLPTVRRVGDQRPLRIADDETQRSAIPDSVITLRPRKRLRPEEELFYASYLGSDKFLGDELSRGRLILVRPAELAQVWLPTADQETLRAIRELTGAAAAFEEWESDAHAAVNSLFQWGDHRAARADIIEAGRLTRQRHEAAQVLANSGTRFRATLPFPIARRWRDVEATSTDDSGYRRVLDCAEASITYCAVLGLAFARAHDITIPCLRAVANKLRSGHTRPAFGDWSAVLLSLAEIGVSTNQPADSPLRYYHRYSVDDVKDGIKSLKGRRNDLAHGRGPAAYEISSNIADAKVELEVVLSASEWLVDYPLRYLETERWDSFKDTSALSYRELMGDHNVVSLGQDETPGHLESGSLYAADQFGRYYLLRPFLCSEYCSDCGQLAVFVIDGWDSADEQAEYKAMDHPHVMRVQRASVALRAAGLLPELRAQ